MKKYIPLLLVAGIAGGIWDYIKSERPVAVEEKTTRWPTQEESLKNVRKHEELVLKKYREQEKLYTDAVRKNQQEARKQMDLDQDHQIYSTKRKGDSTMDTCYRRYGRYKNSADKMRDCIERQLKYEFRP